MRNWCPLVCWSSESKYALFLFELLGESDCEVDIRCTGLNSSGVKRLEWVSREELMDRRWTLKHMHSFALSILQQLTSCQIMSHLEKLFDVAAKAEAESASSPKSNGAPETVSAEEGLSPKEVAAHFDVCLAVKTALSNFRPDHELLKFLSSTLPSFERLQKAVTEIPRTDLRKLKLRFHPDRLIRVLRRAPSAQETDISKQAMQVLNGLTDDSNDARKTVVAGLKELNENRRQLASKDQGENDESSDLSEVKKLLSELSMK